MSDLILNMNNDCNPEQAALDLNSNCSSDKSPILAPSTCDNKGGGPVHWSQIQGRPSCITSCSTLIQYLQSNLTLDATKIVYTNVAPHENVAQALDGIFSILASGVVSSASNGLSLLNPTTVQLGQAVGAAGNPAVFLSDRELPTAGFNLRLTGAGHFMVDQGNLLIGTTSSLGSALPVQIIRNVNGAVTARFQNGTDSTSTVFTSAFIAGTSSGTGAAGSIAVYHPTHTAALDAGMFSVESSANFTNTRGVRISSKGANQIVTMGIGTIDAIRILNNRNVLIGGEWTTTSHTDLGYKLQVTGTTYSSVSVISPIYYGNTGSTGDVSIIPRATANGGTIFFGTQAAMSVTANAHALSIGTTSIGDPLYVVRTATAQTGLTVENQQGGSANAAPRIRLIGRSGATSVWNLWNDLSGPAYQSGLIFFNEFRASSSQSGYVWAVPIQTVPVVTKTVYMFTGVNAAATSTSSIFFQIMEDGNLRLNQNTGNTLIGRTSNTAAGDRLQIEVGAASTLVVNSGASDNPRISTFGSKVLILDGELATNIGHNVNLNGTYQVTIGNRLNRANALGIFSNAGVEVARISNNGSTRVAGSFEASNGQFLGANVTTGNQFTFSGYNLQAGTSQTLVQFAVQNTWTSNNSGRLIGMLVQPTINIPTVGTNATVEGFVYAPTITSVDGATSHKAFYNTVGDNVFNTVSGSTLIGTSIASGFKFRVQGDGGALFNSADGTNSISLTSGNASVRAQLISAGSQTFIRFSNSSSVGGTSSVFGLSGTSYVWNYDSNERMRLTGAGNLIIGSVTDGGQRLQVTGNTVLTGNLTVTGTLTSQFGLIVPTADGAFVSTSATGFWRWITNTSTELMRLFANGNLAIGTTLNPGAKLNVNGAIRGLGFQQGTTSVSTNYTLLGTDFLVKVNATSGPITISLPSATGTGQNSLYVIKKTDASVNVVTIDGNTTETIDGELTAELTTQNETIMILSDGVNWQIL